MLPRKDEMEPDMSLDAAFETAVSVGAAPPVPPGARRPLNANS